MIYLFKLISFEKDLSKSSVIWSKRQTDSTIKNINKDTAPCQIGINVFLGF